MRKWYYNRSFLFTVTFIAISVIAVLTYENLNYITTHFIEFLKYGFGIAGILTTLYNYYHKFHLLISKLRVIMFNSNATWNVNATFEGGFSEEVLNTIQFKLLEMEQESEIVVIDNKKVQVFSKGLTIYLEFTDFIDSDNDDIKGHLLVRVRDYNASYSLAMETLDDKIIPLMALVSEVTKSDDTKYSFKISFGKNNPFMGLVVKNIDKASLVDFSFAYNKTKGISKRNVKVSRKGIECTTTTLSDFQIASGNFLALVGE